MNNERTISDSVKHGLIYGCICGFWILLPMIFIMINSEVNSEISFIGELLFFVIIYPVLITIACLVATSSSEDSIEILIISSVCAISAMMIMNMIVQILILALQAMNNLTIGVELSSFIDFEQILNAFFFSLFVTLIRLIKPMTPIEPASEEKVKIKMPPKPTWDPRLEDIKKEINQSNLEISELKKELWLMKR